MSDLLTCYRWHRQNRLPAVRALAAARSDLAASKSRYPAPGFTAWNAWNPQDVFGFRWIEKPDACGLRFVGFADDLARGIDHTGWFTNRTNQDEVLRGAVYQLPARRGCVLYVPGYADPHNIGAARLSFRDIIEGDPDDNRDKASAAIRADDLARIEAEKEADYNEAWDAGAEAREADAAAKAARAELLAFLRDLRPKKPLLCDAPALIEAARGKVADWLETIRESRERRDKLTDEWINSEGFRDALEEA